MLVTSRASYEMVQKAATMGVTFMAALSAPTSFAIRHAQRCGIDARGVRAAASGTWCTPTASGWWNSRNVVFLNIDSVDSKE